MNKKNRKRIRINHVVPVVILALALFFIFIAEFISVKAEIFVEKGEDYYTAYLTDDQQSWINMDYETGYIQVHMKSKAAEPDNSIRYHTIAFGVSRSQADTMTVVIEKATYNGVKAPSNIAYFSLTDSMKTKDDDLDGYNTSEWTFDKNLVLATLGDDLADITGPTTIYLNAVFDVYTSNKDKTEPVHKGQEWIETWETMMKAEGWSSGSLSGFAKYYNIPLEFNPGSQPAKVYYDYKSPGGNISKYIRDMIKDDGYKVGDTVRWSNEIIPISMEDKSKNIYHIIGCYVKAINTNATIKAPNEWYPDDIEPLDIIKNIKKGSAIMPFGGLEVHFVYEITDPSELEYNNTIYYKYSSTTRKVNEIKLKVGEKLGWASMVSENPPDEAFDAEDLELQRYDVYSADGKTFKTSRNRSDAVTEEDLLDDTVKVEKGGLKVTLTFDKAPVPTPKPDIPGLITPQGGKVEKSLDTIEAIGEIKADVRGDERFNILSGIPSTESLYTQVSAPEYNIGYRLTKKVVVKSYPIVVTAVYHLSWTNAAGTKSTKKDETVKQTINVERACAYWEIEYFDYYTFNKATVYNGALPGGLCTMYPNGAYYSTPSLTITHSSDQDDHIIPPSQYKDGIKLEFTPEPGDGEKPVIEAEDFTYEANAGTDEIRVKSDYLAFDGSVIMDNAVYEKEAPDLANLGALNVNPALSNMNILYQPDQVIPALTLNGVYYSSGVIYYKNHPSAVNSTGSTYDAFIKGLSNVTVHTPVICDASITTENSSTGITGNDPYVQVLNVDDSCLQLVIDPDSALSDFTVDINNFGTHLYIAGYGTRDFAWGTRDPGVSYIAMKNNIYRNEVKFPFDVFWRKTSGEDEYIPKNNWIRFGFATPTFYLPMWVDEGIYTADFRTIAVNGLNTEEQLNKTQVYANTDRSRYVATDSIRVQVSGRLYGLTIYDLTDYPTWETVFRKSEGSAKFKINEGYPSGVTKDKYNEGYAYDYTVGTSDQYGIPTERLEKFTLPLVNGAHPKYTNVGILKTGYSVKFKLTATGNAFYTGDSVVIKPKFYYVDADGKNRREVDIYYTEFFGGKSHKLVKMGSPTDLTNVKNVRCGDKFFGIPDNFLKIMAEIYKTPYNSYLWKTVDLFTYTCTQMRWPLMAYTNTNYLQNLKSGTQYSRITEEGVTDTDIIRRMQTFYGEYYLPADIKAVEKGYDVYGYAAKYGVGENEAFWLKGGYIIINFDIVTEDVNGDKNLSYINSANAANGYCSMWSMENPDTYKVSYNGFRMKSTAFSFLPGDFMVYYTDKSIRDDYETYIVK